MAPRHPEKAHRLDQPVQRKPDWIRVRAPGLPKWAETNRIVRENKLVTVCEAGCPNIGECWEKKACRSSEPAAEEDQTQASVIMSESVGDRGHSMSGDPGWV